MYFLKTQWVSKGNESGQYWLSKRAQPKGSTKMGNRPFSEAVLLLGEAVQKGKTVSVELKGST